MEQAAHEARLNQATLEGEGNKKRGEEHLAKVASLEQKLADAQAKIEQTLERLMLSEERSVALEKEVNDATRERDLREERAGVMASAWRMRAENGESDAKAAKIALAEAEATFQQKSRDLAKLQGALAESQAVLVVEQERVAALEGVKRRLEGEIEQSSRERVENVLNGSPVAEMRALKLIVREQKEQLREAMAMGFVFDSNYSEASTIAVYGKGANLLEEGSRPSTTRTVAMSARAESAMHLKDVKSSMRAHHLAGLARSRHDQGVVRRAFGRILQTVAEREDEGLRAEVALLKSRLDGNMAEKEAELLRKRVPELEERAKAAELKFDQLYGWVQSKAAEARQSANRGF